MLLIFILYNNNNDPNNIQISGNAAGAGLLAVARAAARLPPRPRLRQRGQRGPARRGRGARHPQQAAAAHAGVTGSEHHPASNFVNPLIVCEADLYILMLYVSQLVTLPCSKSN